MSDLINYIKKLNQNKKLRGLNAYFCMCITVCIPICFPCWLGSCFKFFSDAINDMEGGSDF